MAGKATIKHGDIFGKWMVLKEVCCKSKKYKMYLCKCECGKQRIVRGEALRGGRSSSCSRKCSSNQWQNKYPKEYRAWQNMKNRCRNKNVDRYYRYGGRGIEMCKQWGASFETFINDMGAAPGKRYSIDRIDNNKNYCKENCRWATAQEQAWNRSNTKYVKINDDKVPLAKLAKMRKMKYIVLYKRLRSGWSIEDAVNEPVIEFIRRPIPTFGWVYVRTCSETNWQYVGKTVTSPRLRWAKHCNDAKRGSMTKFHKAIRKYGEESFGSVVAFMVPFCHIDMWESFLIKVLNTVEKGYNSKK